MKAIRKMIEQAIDAVARTAAPQKPIVTGNYFALREAMRRWHKITGLKSLPVRSIARPENGLSPQTAVVDNEKARAITVRVF